MQTEHLLEQNVMPSKRFLPIAYSEFMLECTWSAQRLHYDLHVMDSTFQYSSTRNRLFFKPGIIGIDKAAADDQFWMKSEETLRFLHAKHHMNSREQGSTVRIITQRYNWWRKQFTLRNNKPTHPKRNVVPCGWINFGETLYFISRIKMDHNIISKN